MHIAVWKNEKFSPTWKIFRQINSLVIVISLVKTLLSRNFCQKCVGPKRSNFHTVTLWFSRKSISRNFLHVRQNLSFSTLCDQIETFAFEVDSIFRFGLLYSISRFTLFVFDLLLFHLMIHLIEWYLEFVSCIFHEYFTKSVKFLRYKFWYICIYLPFGI